MAAQPDPNDLRLGSVLVLQNGEPSSPLPLEKTLVSAQIFGPIASVHVTQHFDNPFSAPIELEYLFPLPHKAAVVDYQLTIGERHIRADIKELETARRVYQEAVDAGQRASLLEQRRPNIFSLQIGSVQPNEKIICDLHYEERLTFEDGVYQFVFPMGITPRYHSPSISSAVAQSADTATALPGEVIAPVEIHLSLDAGIPVADPVSPSHQLQITRLDAQRLSLELAGTNIPNKDFVLRYAVSGEAIQSAAWGSAEGDSEIVLVTLIPPRLSLDAEPSPREFIFVLDRSGSMSRQPMTQARNALRACLRTLNPQDTFAIQAFDDRIEWFASIPQEVIQANIDLADQWLNSIESRGGTEIIPALDAALALPVDPARQRYVVFLTDGSVSADEQVIRKIARQRGSARIFTFGIGPSVNRFLLDKIARMGRGGAEFLSADEDIESAVTRYQDRVSYPALQDIQLQWRDADAWDTYPETIPDLYVGQPLEIITRLRRKGDPILSFSGQLRGQPIQLDLPIVPFATQDSTIKRLWARARIEALLDQQREQGDQESIRQQVISLSLEYRLLTPFTAFVAVDSEVTSGGQANFIRVSTPLPEGMQYENFFEGAPGGTSLGSVGGAAFLRTGSPAPARMQRTAPSPSQQSVNPPMAMRKRRQLIDDASLDSEAAHFSQLSAAPQPDRDVAEIAPPQQALDFASIDERIKWLARTQKVNGTWDDDLEMTAAALLAFVRAGHTTRTGNYRQQVNKAAKWLLRLLPQAAGFEAFAALRALQELQTATGDQWFADSLRQSFTAPATNLERVAANLPPFDLPDTVASLDDLRARALAMGSAQSPAEMRDNLAQAWLALGKPI